MKREKIVLSDLDFKILEFTKQKKLIREINEKFEMDYALCKKHIDRLRKIKSIDEFKFGNFVYVTINKKGEKILEDIKWVT